MSNWLVSKVTSTLLAKELGLPHIGREVELNNVCSVTDIQTKSLSFSNKSVGQKLEAVLISTACDNTSGITFIQSSQPRLDFIRAIQYLKKEVGFKENLTTSIHHSAKIDQLAQVEAGVVVGKGSVIGPFVHLKSGTRIGKYCDIRAGAKIGYSGFGFEFDDKLKPVEFPHLAQVRILDNVQIGCNSTIARGVLSDTLIRDNVKIDDQVYIAHNCHIDENTLIVAGTSICGSVQIGKNVFVGAGANIKQHCKISDFVTIGMGSNVISDIKQGTTVVGNPAEPLKVNK